MVSLFGTNAEGVPDFDAPIATFNLPPSSVPLGGIAPTPLTVDLTSADITVNEGDVLAIVLQSEVLGSEPGILRSGYSWRLEGSDPYSGGAFYAAHEGSESPTFIPTGSPSGTTDAGFRTYIAEFTVADIDTDGDQVADIIDNCPAVSNAPQIDTDIDGSGDECDSDDDDDGDGVPDNLDSAPLDPLIAGDHDDDGIDSLVDDDDDGDAIFDFYEIAAGLDPFDRSDAQHDPDGDGFNNLDEVIVGTDVNDAESFPGIGFSQIALQGVWLLYEYSDDWSVANDPSWDACAFVVDEVGLLSNSDCLDSDGQDATLSGNLQITPSGRVVLTGARADRYGVLDWYEDIGHTIVAGVGSVGADGLDVVAMHMLARVGFAYKPVDLAGTWRVFEFGDSAGDESRAFWLQSLVNFDDEGNITEGEFYSNADDTGVTHPLTGGVSINDNGLLIREGPWAGDETAADLQMDAGKTVVTGVSTFNTDSAENHTTQIWIKQGFNYSLADLEGVWRLYEFSDGAFQQGPAWARGVLILNAQGDLVGGDVALDDNEIFGLPPGAFSVSINAAGGVDFADFGQMHLDAGKTVMGGVGITDYESGFRDLSFLVGVKSIPGIPEIVPNLLPQGPSGQSAIRWSDNGAGATAYQVYVGNSPGSKLYGQSPVLDADVRRLEGFIPSAIINSVKIHVRLRYKVGTWKWVDYVFDGGDQIPFPELTNPQPGQVLSGASVNFEWSNFNHSGLDKYQVYVGTSPGKADLSKSGLLSRTATSYPATGLPTDGRPVYVRLRYRINSKWAWSDYQFTAAEFARPTLVAPTLGEPLTGSEQSFSWTFNGHPVAKTQFRVGTSLGSKNLASSGTLDNTVLSHTVSGLPTDGRQLYAQLRYLLYGKWHSVHYSFEAADFANPGLTSPTLESVLPGSEVLLQWDLHGQPVQDVRIFVGTGLKGKALRNLADSKSLGASALSYTVTGLPTDGRAIHVQLRYKLFGKWLAENYTFTAANFDKPLLTGPTPGSALDSTRAIFRWSFNGHPVDKTQLYVGTALGSRKLAFSGTLAANITSFVVDDLPADGRPLYVRFRYQLLGKWQFIDYQFKATGQAQPTLIAPVERLLTGSSAFFQWNINGHAVEDTQLWIGSKVGKRNLANSGSLGTSTFSYQAAELPTDGRRLYVRLRYRLQGVWKWADYTFTAANHLAPAITSPVAGSVLADSKPTFAWTANGHPIKDVRISIGTAPRGRKSRNVAHTGAQLPAVTSYQAHGVPVDGSTVYVTLSYRLIGKAFTVVYAYQAAKFNLPKIISPVARSVLPGTTATFMWRTNEQPVQNFRVYIGSAFGKRDLADSSQLGGSVTSFRANDLPEDGRAVYVQLRYKLFDKWLVTNYQYRASGSAQPTLTSPPVSSILGSSSAVFTWNTDGVGDVDSEIWIGTKLGSRNLHKTAGVGVGNTNARTFTPRDLPTDGSNIYVRLRYQVAGKWKWNDYTFKTVSYDVPELLSPVPGTTLTDSTVSFESTTHGHPVQDLRIFVGTSPGKRNIAQSDINLSYYSNPGTATIDYVASGLPTDGRTVHVRLQYRLHGKWRNSDYQYKAANFALPALINPQPGSSFSDSELTFKWTTNGHPIEATQLWVGTSPKGKGRRNLADSGELDPTIKQYSVSGLPTGASAEAENIYVRLRYRILGKWRHVDYLYVVDQSMVNFDLLLNSNSGNPTHGVTITDSPGASGSSVFSSGFSSSVTIQFDPITPDLLPPGFDFQIQPDIYYQTPNNDL